MKTLLAGMLVAVALSCGGCSAITAVNIPGVGYIDFDPPPVTAGDKALMYMAVANAANQQFVGARSTWVNHDTRSRGEYIVTKVKRHPVAPQSRCYSCSGGVPGAELTETIYAGGREFRTSGMGVYLETNGKWYRYQ